MKNLKSFNDKVRVVFAKYGIEYITIHNNTRSYGRQIKYVAYFGKGITKKLESELEKDLSTVLNPMEMESCDYPKRPSKYITVRTTMTEKEYQSRLK